ncbi:MAG: hypothetical protein BWZ06_01345 [Bacteroidetes bacterium ADurb.BinA261]|nr:MAG: hypothetical protein BWZ06_01345 [Bacteroidetes bacterium ADurb.BinA261]
MFDSPLQNLLVEHVVRLAVAGINNADVAFAKIDDIVFGMVSTKTNTHVVFVHRFFVDGQIVEYVKRFGTFGKIAVPECGHACRRFVFGVADFLQVHFAGNKTNKTIEIAALDVGSLLKHRR